MALSAYRVSYASCDVNNQPATGLLPGRPFFFEGVLLRGVELRGTGLRGLVLWGVVLKTSSSEIRAKSSSDPELKSFLGALVEELATIERVGGSLPPS